MTLWTDLKMKCMSLNHYRTDTEDRTTYDISYESLYLRLSDDISHITMIFDDKKKCARKTYFFTFTFVMFSACF